MSYFKEIKQYVNEHVGLIKSISLQDISEPSLKKIKIHIDSTIQIAGVLTKESPQKLKEIIEYLHQQGRFFGWSFPENEVEEKIESSFWELKNKMKKLICSMTGNERLYYFGYLDELGNIPVTQVSAREEILQKLFFT